MTTTAIISGSLQAIARQNNKSIAESFVNADVIVIVDTSGSMAATDSRNSQSRYEIACQELADLQNTLPGKIAVLAFSSDVVFCPDGKPQYFGGGTNLAAALKFAKLADVPGMRFIVISDGEPDDEQKALQTAKTYTNRIDVIYVGPEARPRGRDFLARLAAQAGGQAVTADRAQGLLESAKRLLLSS